MQQSKPVSTLSDDQRRLEADGFVNQMVMEPLLSFLVSAAKTEFAPAELAAELSGLLLRARLGVLMEVARIYRQLTKDPKSGVLLSPSEQEDWQRLFDAVAAFTQAALDEANCDTAAAIDEAVNKARKEWEAALPKRRRVRQKASEAKP